MAVCTAYDNFKGGVIFYELANGTWSKMASFSGDSMGSAVSIYESIAIIGAGGNANRGLCMDDNGTWNKTYTIEGIGKYQSTGSRRWYLWNYFMTGGSSELYIYYSTFYPNKY